ncbi:MAG: DUF3817 domain-containing protein [Flavobacteriales bacterium]|nr:DUF3817 domain-containing protein [Flavobacteriales bacterium]
MQTKTKTLFGTFERIGHIEGISYLVLLLIAMPLKYFAGMPEAVKIVGSIHGVLFIAYCYYLLKVWTKYNWNFYKSAIAFILSLIPFGTFYLCKLRS